MTKKHVILGGLGNLGRHLQRTLAQQGKSVVVLDRHHPQADQLLTGGSVQYQPFCLGYDSPNDLKRILETHEAETVYSLVTPDVQHGTAADFERTNVTGVQHVVDACQDVGVPKLVYASSLAVTNHFVDSVNASEEDPLPPMESYTTSYDRTKRLGEDMVREAAASSSNLSTVCLRLGGILSSPNDYCLRQSFQDGRKGGKIYTISGTKPLDFIAASDIAMAMSKADTVLSSSSSRSKVNGKALFCTKARDGGATTATEIAHYLAKKMNWEIQVLPPAIVSAVRAGSYLQHVLALPFRTQETKPGMPFHLYLKITDYQQTFDNSAIYKALDWAPQLSIWETIDQIVDKYKRDQQEQGQGAAAAATATSSS